MGLVRKPKCGVESLGTQKTRRATLQFSLLLLLKSPSAYNIANYVIPCVQPVMNL